MWQLRYIRTVSAFLLSTYFPFVYFYFWFTLSVNHHRFTSQWTWEDNEACVVRMDNSQGRGCRESADTGVWCHFQHGCCSTYGSTAIVLLSVTQEPVAIYIYIYNWSTQCPFLKSKRYQGLIVFWWTKLPGCSCQNTHGNNFSHPSDFPANIH